MPALCIAHRGGAALVPENTLAAFADAIARGCDGAELDVQLLADGNVAVHHDYHLNAALARDAEGEWLRKPTPRIKDLTAADLAQYDVGRPGPKSEYTRAHPLLKPVDGERIPLLDDVIALARRAPKPFRLFIELKTSFSDRGLTAPPQDLAEAVVRLVRAADFTDRAVIIGFDWPGLLHARLIAPEIPCWFTTLAQSWFEPGEPPPETDPPPSAHLAVLRYWAESGTSPWAGGFDAVKYDGSILKAIQAAGGAGWFPPYYDVSAERLAQARALGLKVGAWTVDDPDVMRSLIGLGIDAICTDRPDLFPR